MQAAIIKKLDKAKTAEYAATVVAEHFGGNVLSVKYLGGGSYGMVYKVVLDKSPYIAVAKAFKVNELYRIEAAGLIELRASTTMKIPEVYFTYEKTDKIPVDFVCMEYIDAVNCLTHVAFLLNSKRKKLLFAEKVVDALLQIHSKPHEKFGDILNPVYDKWLDYYRPFAEDIKTTANELVKAGRLEAYIADTLNAAYRQFDSIFSEEVKEASLIHGDLNVMNIMSTKNQLEPVAFIDPLEPKYGDREYDLFQFNNLTGKCFGLYDMYKQKYAVSKNCDIKCAFYGLYNEVYVFIKTGAIVKLIMNPLIKNMKKQLKKLEALQNMQ
ncbi:MAG: aminoglycoside phosphotransferase family protein [Clostridia bacterium]|nr:aminoglycoside phosphotransferase family protein [Clostridia bacterium]